MTEDQPIDIPHKLGREAARERIKARIGKLAGFIPGGGTSADAAALLRRDAERYAALIRGAGIRME